MNTPSMPRNRVVGQLIAVVVFWGLNVVFTKYLTAYFSPMGLVTLRLLIATSILLPAVFLRYGLVRLTPAAWLPIAGVTLCIFLVHHLSLAMGAARTSATHGVLILGLIPLTTMLLAAGFLKEALTRAKLIGVVLGIGGVSLIALSKENALGATLNGDLLMLLSMGAYAVGTILVKKSTAYASPLVITDYSMAAASVVMLVATLALDLRWTVSQEAYGVGSIAAMLFIGALSTGLGTLWWNNGVHHLGASTTALFFNGVPVVGVIAAILFFREQLLLAHVLALLLVLAGISLGSGFFAAKKT